MDLKIMPKLELHAHLNGSLSRKTLEKLSLMNPERTFQTEWPSFAKALDNLPSCFELFKIAHNLTTTPGAVRTATIETLNEFACDGVLYIELRTTPRAERGMSKHDYLDAVVAGVKDSAELDPPIYATVLVSINRSEGFDSGKQNLEIALEYAQLYPYIVVGVDLSGDPSKSNFQEFAPLLATARAAGLKTAVHCAEIDNPAETSDIIDSGLADRLGHGTCLNEQHLDKLRKTNIPVEVCISSNVKCGTVVDVESHHFKRLKLLGIPYIFCTDDKGVFDTSLTQEYILAASVSNMSTLEFWRMNFQAIEYSFAPTNLKEKLRYQLNQWKETNMK